MIVYFNEMPASLDAFASSYGVKLIFARPEIKMAAFETMPEAQSNAMSDIAKNFIDNVSKDSSVESAEFDTFMFVDTTMDFTQPWVVTPEDLERNNTSYVPDKVSVGFWRMPPSLDEFGAKYGGTLVNSSVDYGLNVNYRLKFATFTTSNMTDFIKKVSSDPYVSSAAPIQIGHISGWLDAPPNDPEYVNGNQWYISDTNTLPAWYYDTGSNSIIIAIIDTGVDYNHQDLAGRVIHGWNYIAGNNDPMDDNNHGTMCAGIAAATINNGIGIAGISQSQILAIKAANSQGSINSGVAANAIDWAVSHGANIISMSFGFDESDPNLLRACTDAYNSGRLLFASTGDTGGPIQYPANYAGYVLAIGGINHNDQWWNDQNGASNFGPNMFLVAPSVDIRSTVRGNQYGWGDATSFAVPQVAGVAALIWSENPGFSNQKVSNVLGRSATTLAGGYQWNYYGNGKLNGFEATTWGQMLAEVSDSLPGTNYYQTWQLNNVPANSYIYTVMAGNENSNFDLYAKWNSPPTPTSYDARGTSQHCIESVLTKGSGTLYIVVPSINGAGNYKLWFLSGNPSNSQYSYGTLPGTSYASGLSVWGVGNGYAFNSGPDGSDFDLYIKWYSQPSLSNYDATGQTPDPCEYAGPASGWGSGVNMMSNYLNCMVYSYSGSGPFGLLGVIF